MSAVLILLVWLDPLLMLVGPMQRKSKLASSHQFAGAVCRNFLQSVAVGKFPQWVALPGEVPENPVFKEVPNTLLADV
jgi:hypothetical protein